VDRRSQKIADYVAARNAVLLTGDVDAVIAFYLKHNNPDALKFDNREAAEIAMHKARTAAVGLPMKARRLSKTWLIERGYTPWDDGDV
jgi:hypothetical protein